MATCAQCEKARATTESPTGRPLCEACRTQMTQLGAAGSAMVAGESIATAVGTGIAAGGLAGATEGEAKASAARRAKLDATEGFWRRLWVRIWG